MQKLNFEKNSVIPGGTSILFKRPEQTTLGLIHEDDGDIYGHFSSPGDEHGTYLRMIFIRIIGTWCGSVQTIL
jgi:hypothetical protein